MSEATTKSDDRRAAILERLVDHVLDHGLSAASLRPLAAAAGTSDRMLLYYFRDKAEVIAAVLERIVARLVTLIDAQSSADPLPFEQLRAELPAFLLSDELWPYMRIWLEVASHSARGDPFYRVVGEQIGRGFLAWGAARLDSATLEARATDAARLLVTMEGMLVLKSVGLDDVIEQAI